ncbi:hypothetical protein GCM10010357_28650 [Streptomyces luteireticuli]|uniref:FxLD family lantipeptide n=1 Tax=Streptomyces luteireticuli TaxID=173858 RepID=A0ABP3IIQ9_9ACTN
MNPEKLNVLMFAAGNEPDNTDIEDGDGNGSNPNQGCGDN